MGKYSPPVRDIFHSRDFFLNKKSFLFFSISFSNSKKENKINEFRESIKGESRVFLPSRTISNDFLSIKRSFMGRGSIWLSLRLGCWSKDWKLQGWRRGETKREKRNLICASKWCYKHLLSKKISTSILTFCVCA